MLYSRPDLMHRILEANTVAVTEYLNAQIEAGAQAVMLFDTWGGSLAHQAFHDFSLAYIQRILAGLKREHDGARVPSVVFVKGGGAWLEAIASVGCDALGVDWTLDIGEARERVGNRVALQGNLDPMVLMSSPQAIVRETRAILDAYGPGPGHVFNLGHGISQFTPPEHVAVLVETVHEYSKAQRQNQR
jgi:uroporphyrinogen decarboxylase